MSRDIRQLLDFKMRYLALRLAVIIVAIGSLTVNADPAWWYVSGRSPDDFAAVNQGQVKNMVKAAVDELERHFPGGAGNKLKGLIESWNPTAPSPKADDFAVATTGQVKYAAQLVYDRLIEGGFATAYPWDLPLPGNKPRPTPDDNAVANIGQLKNLFSFDVWAGATSDTLPDWWSIKYFGAPGARANDDPDGDYTTNLVEYLTGTDPSDYFNGQLASMNTSIVSGDQQLMAPGVVSGQPLKIIIKDQYQSPRINAPMLFQVISGSSLVSVNQTTNWGVAATLTTDSDGCASVWVRGADREENFTVRVWPKGSTGLGQSVDFHGMVANPVFTVVSGDGQSVTPTMVGNLPLVVQLANSQGAALAGVPVTFQTVEGTSQLSVDQSDPSNWSTTVAAKTDANGRAQVWLQAATVEETVTVDAQIMLGSAHIVSFRENVSYQDLEFTVPPNTTSSQVVKLSGLNVTNGPLTWSLQLIGTAKPSTSGLPDYRFSNSKQSPGGPQYAWQDIRGNGAANITDAYASKDISFQFPFYGASYSKVNVYRNGYLKFETPITQGMLSYSWLPWPAVHTLIASYLRDLGVPSGGGGGVYFKDFGDYAIIQYQGMGDGFSASSYTFEIKLTRMGEIYFYYNSMTAGQNSDDKNWGTVGIQDTSGSKSVVFSAYPNYVNFVDNQMAVAILPNTWLRFSDISGSVDSGADLMLNASFDTSGLNENDKFSALLSVQDGNGKLLAARSIHLSVTVKGDSNGNGIPDWWELQYFGRLLNNDFKSGNEALADADGDGVSNYQEYLNKTDPTDYFDGAIATTNITKTAGDKQSVTAGAISNPLVVHLQNSNGVPLQNAPVTFGTSSASNPISATNASPNWVSTISTLTDTEGNAQVWFLGGPVEGPLSVTAHAGQPTRIGPSVQFDGTVSYQEVDYTVIPDGNRSGTLALPPFSGSESVLWSVEIEGGAKPAGLPDYVAVKSTDPDGPAYVWTDISGQGDISNRGELLNMSSSSGAVQRSISFRFPFYGQSYAQVNINKQGYLSFGPLTNNSQNTVLPSVTAPRNLIAAYWRNLSAMSSSSVYFKDFGTYVIVQYQGMQTNAGATSFTFQVKLTADGEIYFYYNDMQGASGIYEDVANATVGLQNGDATSALLLAYNASLTGDPPYVQNGLAVKIAPNSWLKASPSFGTLETGAALNLTLSLNAVGLSSGDTVRGVLRVWNSAGAALVTRAIGMQVTLDGDSDGNGLPDWWEIQYFGHIGVDPNQSGADGLTYRQKYLNGLDPLHDYTGQLGDNNAPVINLIAPVGAVLVP